MPVPVLPIVFVLSAAVGAATGIASVAIQGEHHKQLQKQLKDNEELVDLQKELDKLQLKQYKKEEKMFGKAGNINLSMPTRSQAGGLGFASRGTNNLMETNFCGTLAAATTG